MRIHTAFFIGCLIAAKSSAATASPLILDFEGVADQCPSQSTEILDYYNGGFSSAGTSGPNLGVAFNNKALAVCSTVSRRSVLFFEYDYSEFVNVANGFENQVSFSYASAVPIRFALYDSVFDFDDPQTIRIDPSSRKIAQLTLPSTTSSCLGIRCTFFEVTLTFDGKAKGMQFGNAYEYAFFDNISLGKVSAIPLPPGFTLLTIATAGLGLLGLRRSFIPEKT